MSDLVQYNHRPNPKCRGEVLITVEHGYHYREVMRAVWTDSYRWRSNPL